MYKLIQLAQNKVAIALTAVVVMCAALAPVATFAQIDNNDTFGLSKFNDDSTNGGLALGKKGLQETVAQLINVALGLLGVVAVVIILIGGFMWMTAGGNDEKVEAGRKYITSGIIGLAIILSAWAIATFVFKSLQTATGSGALPAGL